MYKYEDDIVNVLKALEKAGALEYIVVAGSWAMYFYRLIFDGFVPRVETTDLDLFLPNPKKAKSQNLSSLLVECSYVKNTDYLTGITRFISQDAGFKIEFLTTPDRTLSNALVIPGFGVVAEALPKMAPAGWNYIQVPFHDLIVNVVSPVSFVLQKLLINKERKDEYKKNKDLDAIKYVLGFVKMSVKYSKELEESLTTYPKKWKKRILETAEENNITL